MSMKIFAKSNLWPRPASGMNLTTKVGLISATFITSLQLAGIEAMSQPNCDVVRIAEDYVRTHLPFIQIANRRWSSSGEADLSIVRLELPDGHLGFVPEITIDKRNCQVVRAKVWQ